eukprot:350976-Chlamydomonas_euryale.AAC.6
MLAFRSSACYGAAIYAAGHGRTGGAACRWQALKSTEADNTAGAMLPASASDRQRETVEQFDGQEAEAGL